MTADTPSEQTATHVEESPIDGQAEASGLRVDPEERLVPVLSVQPRRSNGAVFARRALSVTTHVGMILAATIIFLVALSFVLDDPEPTRTPSQSASMRY